MLFVSVGNIYDYRNFKIGLHIFIVFQAVTQNIYNKNTTPVVAGEFGAAGYNTTVNGERNKGAFVMGSDAMNINTLLYRSQRLAKSNRKGGGK